MANGICKLCLARSADKKKSHIISKFLSKGLFTSTKPRHTLSINRSGYGRKLQDTPKEDHILCTICEKRIEVLETYFARKVEQIQNYSNLPNEFTVRSLGNQVYLECNFIHPTLFKLFIYSLVWRSSISNLAEFQKFKLSKPVEEELRSFLNLVLTINQQSLFNSLEDAVHIPKYDSCFIKPRGKLRGVFSTYSMSPFSHLLLLVDFGLLFYTDETSMGPILGKFSNKQNEKVIIALGEDNAWQDLNKIVLSKMLNK